jgi:hypothetical protein
MSGIDLASMSDEDIMNMMEAPAAAPDQGAVTEPEEDLVETGEVVDDGGQTEAPAETGDQPVGQGAEEDVPDDELGDTPPVAQPDAQSKAVADGVPPPATTAAVQPQAPVTAGAPEAVNYEEAYKKIMAPFRANGREFTPSSPEEVIQLAQLGANYTKKMQGLKPHLKMLRMLETNGLLQEDKISFLIDLEKKDPKAIQKLLHDGKVDPMDLDATAEPDYKPGNHKVTDHEMQWQEVIDDLYLSDEGKATVAMVHKTWDPVSKEAAYADPNILKVIDQQRSNGIYATITAEIERRKILGQFGSTPFIQAYKTVGDELFHAGKLLPAGSVPAAPTPGPAALQPQPVETRPARPRAPTATRDQARAISPAPGSTTKATPKPAIDPFAMTDEQIMAIPTKF